MFNNQLQILEYLSLHRSNYPSKCFFFFSFPCHMSSLRLSNWRWFACLDTLSLDFQTLNTKQPLHWERKYSSKSFQWSFCRLLSVFCFLYDNFLQTFLKNGIMKVSCEERRRFFLAFFCQDLEFSSSLPKASYFTTIDYCTCLRLYYSFPRALWTSAWDRLFRTSILISAYLDHCLGVVIPTSSIPKPKHNQTSPSSC